MGVRIFAIAAIFFLVVGLWSCGGGSRLKRSASSNNVVCGAIYRPTREPYDGFEWEYVFGKYMAFWAQKSSDIRVVASDSLPEAFIERFENGRFVPIAKIIEIFELENQRIESVLSTLQRSSEWSDCDCCKFHKIKSNSVDVDRYVLKPTGRVLREFRARGATEPITTTCGSWGEGNSGVRYFEIHKNHKDKIVFVEIGQEMPLFDENSLKIK